MRNRALETEFADVFAEEVDGLRRFAFSMCGDWSHADDAVSEAFARTWPKWRRGKVQNMPAYLRRAVVNQLKGRWRHRWVEKREEDARYGDGRGAREPDDVLADRGLLVDALLELPERQRAAVALRYFDDMSVEDTADVLGVSAGTVKAQVSRGLDRLRELIGEEEVPA